MCKTDPTDPTQWNKDCVYGKCKSCTEPQFDILAGKATEPITYSQWAYGIDETKKKWQEIKNLSLAENKKSKKPGKVFGLFQTTVSIKNCSRNFKKHVAKIQGTCLYCLLSVECPFIEQRKLGQ